MKPQLRVQRRGVRRSPTPTDRLWMAYPPRQENPDRAIVDAAWIAWSIAILLWIGAMSGGLKP